MVGTGQIWDDAVTPAKLANSVLEIGFSAAAFGTWAEDGDGAYTNGGGIVGDILLTTAAAAYCQVCDWAAGVPAYAPLSNSSALPGWTANWQLSADAANEEAGTAGPGNDDGDAIYFGNDVPFCELAVELGGAVGICAVKVWEWEFWDGTGWDTLPIAYDNTDLANQDGEQSFEQAGAISFAPPTATWQPNAVNGTTAYWVRARCVAAQITQTPVNTDEHAIVSPQDGIEAPCDCGIWGLRVTDGTTAALHTTRDIKFVLMNFTTGSNTGELTWAQDKRSDSWGPGTMNHINCADGDILGVLVTQDDGAAEAINVHLEMIATRV